MHQQPGFVSFNRLREKKEKLLIFSQFKIVLDIIEDWLTWKKYSLYDFGKEWYVLYQ